MNRPGVASPTRRGWVTLVMLSPMTPESSAATRRSVGVPGFRLLMVTVMGAEAGLRLPATSCSRTLRT